MMRDDPFYDDDMIRGALLGNVSRCFLFIKSIINLGLNILFCRLLFYVVRCAGSRQSRAGKLRLTYLCCLLHVMF